VIARQWKPVSESSNVPYWEDKHMEGILFLVFWLGGAALHTLFDLKIKPVVQALGDESDFS
jgi:hypothetical protein